jgi:hypothetical protein
LECAGEFGNADWKRVQQARLREPALKLDRMGDILIRISNFEYA